MKRNTILLSLLFSLVLNGPAQGGMNDDPLLAMARINQLEIDVADDDIPLVWDAEGWIGKDFNKLWIKTDGGYIEGQVEEGEIQALYSRAIAPFWDMQIGWRGDIRPNPNRDWLTLGIKGLAPYYFDIDAAFFVGESSRTAFRLQLEYEIMFTQRLILVPDFELNLYGKDDPSVGIGSGITDVEAGLRLRYEIRREFAPYIGVNWIHLYGDTADYARLEGKDIDDFQLVFGVRAWF